MMNELAKGKSFWEKPQGTVGMIGGALLAVGAGWLILSNAAWLAAAMANLTTAVFMGIGLFSLAWLLSDKKVRLLIWYFYKSMIEKATSLFIEIDPIGIIKVYVEELKAKRKNMHNQLTKLKNEIGKLTRKISDTEAEMKEFVKLGNMAVSKGKTPKNLAQAKAYGRKGARRKDARKKLLVLKNRIDKLYVQMDKMYYYSGIMVDDTSDQVEMLEAERKTIHASYSVMKSAQSIINGGTDEADMFERAMQSVADDIGGKLGEMDRFMDMSQNFIDGVDLENEVFEMEGLAMLDAWEEDNSMAFLEQGTVDYTSLVFDNDADVKVLKSTKITKPQNSNTKTNFFN